MDDIDTFRRAIIEDSERRRYEHWLKGYKIIPGAVSASRPQFIPTPEFFRRLRLIARDLDHALGVLITLPELEPHAPDLAFHLHAALESLQPLLRRPDAGPENEEDDPVDDEGCKGAACMGEVGECTLPSRILAELKQVTVRNLGAAERRETLRAFEQLLGTTRPDANAGLQAQGFQGALHQAANRCQPK